MSTEYPKIQTLYERDPKTFKLLPQLTMKNPVYGIIKTWLWTEKIDGTNIRITYLPTGWEDMDAAYDADEFPVLIIGGRTNKAQIHTDLIRWIQEHIALESMTAVFHDATEPVVLYGEGYGAGIQKVGIKYGPTKKFILFDVKIGRTWLSDANMRDIANKLGIQAVPDFGERTLEDATKWVRHGVPCMVPECEDGFNAEGLVGRTIEPLFDKRGARLIVKLKTKDFEVTN